MSLKSILRAVGRHFASWPMIYRPDPEAASNAALDRLTMRSDWNKPGIAMPFDPSNPAHVIVSDGEGVDPNRPPSPPWPPQDDPYAKPEPCDVVPDAGLERVRKLTERGLVMPVGDKSTLSQIMELIDRQEDAEKHLRSVGMVWERGRGWYLPIPHFGP